MKMRLPEATGSGRPARQFSFTFNGRRLTGREGDTLSAALIANGVRLVGRSFKYHRPRGVVGYGAEEPNALVQLGSGAHSEPNIKATQIELFDGLQAQSQNCWPSVEFDLGALTGVLSPLLPAGFYYKTFMGPPFGWRHFEWAIRKVAGMGRAPELPDPDRYDHRHAHVEVLVIGGGAAGLATASSAAARGVDVLLVDDQPRLGGTGTDPSSLVAGRPYEQWVAALERELEARPNVTLLRRSTAFGLYDQNLVGIVETANGHGAGQPRQRRWMVRAKTIILATGACERPLIFVHNDLPGVMLAGAARLYVNRHGALPGRRAVVFTNNDSAYAAALDLQRAGIAIAAIVDVRPEIDGELPGRARAAGIACLAGQAVIAAHGRNAVTGCEVMPLHRNGAAVTGDSRRFACDLLLTSGGWNPLLHLATHLGVKTTYAEALGAFLPEPASPAMRCIGACRGSFDLVDCITQGLVAGVEAVAGNAEIAAEVAPLAIDAVHEAPLQPFWVSPLPANGRGKQFVDLQNDVTVDDLKLAVREGYRSIEHVKRYTTMGMGSDQGKLGNTIAAAVVSAAQASDPAAIGTPRFRPPYSPLTFGAMAGRHTGEFFAPARVTPLHGLFESAGATFANIGTWKRAQFFTRSGESEFDAVNREALNVRQAVGVTDVSTLGKFDIQGKDAAEFLDLVYANGWKSLQIGKCRYGVMLREDGMVLDDGTTSRLSESRYFMTTTTGNAERIFAHLEQCRQVLRPHLDVTLTPVTEHWGAVAIAGPRARDLLQALRPDFAIDNHALPFLAMREGRLGDLAARVFRISFSGELAYEIYVPAGRLRALWPLIAEAGRAFGLMPYGTDAMMTLRIEKGFFAPGFEGDGRTTLDDLGLGRMINGSKDCIGKRSLRRSHFSAPDRKQLVGLVAVDPTASIPRGAQLATQIEQPPPVPMEGHVTSCAFSPNLGRWIALALVKAGRARHGEIMTAQSPLTNEAVRVKIESPVFIDPEGARLHA